MNTPQFNKDKSFIEAERVYWLARLNHNVKYKLAFSFSSDSIFASTERCLFNSSFKRNREAYDIENKELYTDCI